MKITSDILLKWSACAEGMAYFKEHFPQGAGYVDVQTKLREDKRGDWMGWLTDAMFAAVTTSPEGIAALVANEVAYTLKATAGSPNFASGNFSKAASSGYGSKAASSGYGSKAASSGSRSTAASSGDFSTAASSGYGSKAASVGLRCKSMAGENGCFVLFWNDGTRDRAAVGYVGEDGIKADTLYCVNSEGRLTEV